MLDYIGTLPEAPGRRIPIREWTFSLNPQSRYQVTENLANQTEATFKFDIGGGRTRRRRRRSLARDRVGIDRYTGP